MRTIKSFKGELIAPDIELKEYQTSPFEVIKILQKKKYKLIKENGYNYYGIFIRKVNKKNEKKFNYYLTEMFLNLDDAKEYLESYNIDLKPFIAKGYDINKLENIIHLTKDMEFSLKYCTINPDACLMVIMNYLSMSKVTFDIGDLLGLIYPKKVKADTILLMLENIMPKQPLFHPYISTKNNIDITDQRILNIRQYAKKSLADISDEINIRFKMGGQELVDEWLDLYKSADNKKIKKGKK